MTYGACLFIEENYTVGIFQTRLQLFKYFRLDNILCPVLIRAFDVVVDGKTSISVTTNCDVNDWPAIQKEIEAIELTFNLAAKK
jgi:hypothetical protein